MDTGQTYIDINYNAAWIEARISEVQGFGWLFQWGMYVFLLAAIAVCVWVFVDSVQKKTGSKALVPRILSIVGVFLTLPAFIFRYTGTADGVTHLVRLGAESGTPYYSGAINWNVNWLVAGLGPAIAMLCLAGVVCAIVAMAVYMSAVHRVKYDKETLFARQLSDLDRKVGEASARPAAQPQASRAATAGAVAAASSAPASASARTVFDAQPQAATVIDMPASSASLAFASGPRAGHLVRLAARPSVIGRGAGSQVVVDDPKVSGSHARIEPSGSGWALADLGSTNGTFVNGARISGPQALRDGDQVRVGDTTLTFSLGK